MDAAQQIPMNQGNMQITASAFAAKFQSKRGKFRISSLLTPFSAIEVYRFLSSEVHAYLDSFETMTIWHLRDLASGIKRIIKCEAVKVISIPQFEGLTIPDLLDFAKGYPAIAHAFPVEKEISKLSRAYIGNVIYTLIGEIFSTWVQLRVTERNVKVSEEGNQIISMDPDVMRIFAQSTSVSGKNVNEFVQI